MKRTVASLGDLAGRTALVRVDFNVPLQGGAITDDSRIRAALPTIRELVQKRARVVLCSHLGRPKQDQPEKWPGLSLRPAAVRLGDLLGQEVAFAAECIGQMAVAAKTAVAPGGVLLLENTRFHPEEEKNEDGFAGALATGCDLFVNDAFGAVHRAHASTVGVTAHLSPCVMGYLVERELEVLTEILEHPTRPLVVILGGAKVADKLPVTRNMLKLADTLIIGGGMAYTFLKANGYEVGNSLLDADSVEDVKAVQAEAVIAGVPIVLPRDATVVAELKADAPAATVPIDAIPPDQEAVDIGPLTREQFIAVIRDAGMVFWNGPMGVFELAPFAEGTNALARALADSSAKVVIGGGDSGAAVVQAGVADRMYHMCTGGGASLEFLEGRELPGIAALDEA